MKRIGLFLGVEPSAGGMFQYAQSLLDALDALPRGHYKVEIACASQAWREVLSGYSFPITWLKRGKFGLQLADASMVARIPGRLARALSRVSNPIGWQLNRLNCDIWIFPAQDAIAYQLGLPVIATVHDLMHRYEPHFPEVAGWRRFHIREHRFRNLVTWAKGVLVDSEVGRGHVVNAYSTDPAKIYPLRYIPPRYILQTRMGDGFDSRYTLPDKFLFYPAQFWAHKNHEAFVSAAASIRVKCPDIHLVFAGGKRHGFEQLRTHAATIGMLDRITFPGYVPDADLPEFYRRARAMVMPTFFGPTNIPPLEALACDCPVAVSGIYAMPEQLGDAALYFEPRSVAGIASAIERLWLDDKLCETLRERGRRRVASWNQHHFNGRVENILAAVLFEVDKVREAGRPFFRWRKPPVSS